MNILKFQPKKKFGRNLVLVFFWGGGSVHTHEYRRQIVIGVDQIRYTKTLASHLSSFIFHKSVTVIEVNLSIF